MVIYSYPLYLTCSVKAQTISILFYSYHMSVYRISSSIFNKRVRVEITVGLGSEHQVQVLARSISNHGTLKKTHNFSRCQVSTSVKRIIGPSRKYFLNHCTGVRNCYFCLWIPTERV